MYIRWRHCAQVRTASYVLKQSASGCAWRDVGGGCWGDWGSIDRSFVSRNLDWRWSMDNIGLYAHFTILAGDHPVLPVISAVLYTCIACVSEDYTTTRDEYSPNELSATSQWSCSSIVCELARIMITDMILTLLSRDAAQSAVLPWQSSVRLWRTDVEVFRSYWPRWATSKLITHMIRLRCSLSAARNINLSKRNSPKFHVEFECGYGC